MEVFLSAGAEVNQVNDKGESLFADYMKVYGHADKK
jgi:hypothetical protein